MAKLLKFITRANIKYNNKYDYSLVNYANSSTKIKIICPIHGVFEQRPNDHLNIKSYGCGKCGKIAANIKVNKNRLITEDIILTRFMAVHGDVYDYTNLNYINTNINVNIICKIHGTFSQSVNNHCKGHGCPKCNLIVVTTDNVIEKFKKKFKNLYDYSLVNYINAFTKIKIICSKHGIFEQLPNNFLNGLGCPICKSSKGEIIVMNWLDKNNMMYERQKRFNQCIDKKKLPFDFYLPDYNICIEYDGEQHFIPRSFNNDNSEEIKNSNLKNIKRRDKIKDEYCHNNNIHLIRIPYYRIQDIDNILNLGVLNPSSISL